MRRSKRRPLGMLVVLAAAVLLGAVGGALFARVTAPIPLSVAEDFTVRAATAVTMNHSP
ncbi:MAG: hypothetical protein HYY16_12065 [Planctomycetes bacterium]|nr:hypothetical protein [Planctomycetota bacterium]